MNVKTLAILVASISALSLTACGKNKDEATRLSDATQQQQQSQPASPAPKDQNKADNPTMPPAANPNPAAPAQETPSNPQEAPKTTQ